MGRRNVCRRLLGGKRGRRAQWQQNAISAAQTENESPTWTYVGPVSRRQSRCMAVPDESTNSSHSLGSPAVGWPARRQAVCGRRWMQDNLGLCLASMHWPRWAQATHGLTPTTWTMFGWPRGTATAATPTASAFWKRGMVEQLGRRCRLGLRRRTNNAFMSFVPTPPKTDISGWGEIWGCSPQRTVGGRLCCKALVLR